MENTQWFVPESGSYITAPTLLSAVPQVDLRASNEDYLERHPELQTFVSLFMKSGSRKGEEWVVSQCNHFTCYDDSPLLLLLLLLLFALSSVPSFQSSA